MARSKKAEKDLHELLGLAAAHVRDKPTLSRNAVRDALRIASRFRVRIPREQKRRLCKHCYTYLQPGVTSTSRVRSGRIIITCSNCGAIKRLQYRR